MSVLEDLVSRGSMRWYKGDLLNSDGVASLGTKIVEQLCCALVSVGVLAEGIDDPHLSEVDGSGKSSGVRVSGDELDILDTTSLF